MWDFKEIEADTKMVTGALVAIFALLGVLAKYWAGFMKFLKATGRFINRFRPAYKARKKAFSALDRLEGIVTEVVEQNKVMQGQMQAMHYQLHPNGGGSLRDDITAIRAKMSFLCEVDELRFLGLPYPAFHCDENGLNVRISRAYMQLLGLTNVEALGNLNWHGYIETDDIERYFSAFKTAVQAKSDFRHPARFRNNCGDDLGVWMVEATRLKDGSYLGRFRPSSEVSRKICEVQDWED